MATLLQHATFSKPPQHLRVIGPSLNLKCPACGAPMGAIDPWEESAPQECSACYFVLHCRQGIWNALPPGREEKFSRFIEEYQNVRWQEGRGSGGGLYYLALPYQDITGRNAWQWKIRSRSFRYLTRRILPRLEQQHRGGLDILDVGAGNSWMSYRLALRGHRPVAVDLLVNGLDGLGAARHYFAYLPRSFPRFRAEMNCLPFAERQFDVVMFNASFHYSEDYGRTIAEALRCLRRPGSVLIIDSPFYHRDESGRQMVEERRARFQQKYGFRSDSISAREYLTPAVLDTLSRQFGLAWNVLKPWYGIGWALRPVRTRLRGRREPANFHIFWGQVE